MVVSDSFFVGILYTLVLVVCNVPINLTSADMILPTIDDLCFTMLYLRRYDEQ